MTARFAIPAACMLTLTAAAAGAPPEAGDRPPPACHMKWPFPKLKNPTIIDLDKTGDRDWWHFEPDQDVVFLGASTPRTLRRLQTEGGRNIVVLGGEYRPQGPATGTLYFAGVSGAVHVEGALIDNADAGERDGIDIYSAPGRHADLTVQNTRIVNISGHRMGVHGDMVQTQGDVGRLRFYNVSGTTGYEGLFIPPQHATRSADLENVNIRYTDGQPVDRYTYQYWFLDSILEKPFPIALDHVYATERPGQAAQEYTVWPKASLLRIGAVRRGNGISWPHLPYRGSITVGDPPGGDFAPSETVGIGYRNACPDNTPITGPGAVRSE